MNPDNRLQFVINASQPASDKIFDVSAFEKFLNEKIKVDGRVGNLGETIKISQTGDGKIEIVAHNELSGRYLKYLYGTPAPHHRLEYQANTRQQHQEVP